MKGTRRTRQGMSLSAPRSDGAGNSPENTGIAPRPLPVHATPDVPLRVPLRVPSDVPLAHASRPPALARARLFTPKSGGENPLKGGFFPTTGNRGGFTLGGALTLSLWRLASRLAPWLLNRRWFRAVVMLRASRHANRREG
jgi:hypothetical protein